MNPFTVISALVGLVTLAGIFVTLGRLLAKVESIDERQRELMDPKTGLVATLRGRTHELANADTALANALALLTQRFDLHVKESETEHRRLLGEIGKLERVCERLSERPSGAGS